MTLQVQALELVLSLAFQRTTCRPLERVWEQNVPRGGAPRSQGARPRPRPRPGQPEREAGRKNSTFIAFSAAKRWSQCPVGYHAGLMWGSTRGPMAGRPGFLPGGPLAGPAPTRPAPHSGCAGNQAEGRRAAPGGVAGPAPPRLWEGVWPARLWGDLRLCS